MAGTVDLAEIRQLAPWVLDVIECPTCKGRGRVLISNMPVSRSWWQGGVGRAMPLKPGQRVHMGQCHICHGSGALECTVPNSGYGATPWPYTLPGTS